MGSSEDPSWRSYLVRIGDSCAEYGETDADEHVETCTAVIFREMKRYEDELLDLLLECIEELPHKHPYYGVVVGLTNLDHTEFVSQLLERIRRRLQDAIDNHHCNRLRILLRFLAVLMCSNVLSSTSLIEAFDVLLSSAATTVDEEAGNPAWQPRADFYVFCILASLPFCALELQERAPDELERVMAAAEAYFSLRTRRVSDPSVNPFNVDPDGDESMTGEDYLQDLWSRLQKLQQSGWKLESVPRPHLSFEARLATSQTSHQLRALTCQAAPKGDKDMSFSKQRQDAESKYPPQTGGLRVFPPEKSEKDMQPIDRFIVEQYLLDILFYLNGSRKECAAYIVGLPVPFRYDYIIAETVIGQMLLLPNPPFRLVYYTIVIIDLCKALPRSFPAVLAGAVHNLFNRLAELDVECQTRLIQWLSHHMSNFQFIWPWEDWAHVLEQPIWSPQRVFVQELLDKEIRLSYWERVKQSLDGCPKLCDLLPPKNTPEFKLSKEKHVEGLENEVAFSSELMAQIKTKKTIKDLEAWLDAKVVPAAGQKVAIEILLQTLLHLGSKSFTHMVTVLERYGQLIGKVASDEQMQVIVIEEVATFWQNSSQMTAIVIDRMMGYRLLSNIAIARWIFSESNIQTFHTSNRIWEILYNVINKTTNRTADLKKDIVKATTALEEANAAAAKAETSRSNVQILIDSAETEEARRQSLSRMEWVKTTISKAKTRQEAAQDLLETKGALLARASREQETLFLSVFKHFANVITEKLSKAGNENAMEIDVEDPSTNDNERRNERFRTNEAEKNVSKDEEVKHWQRCTVGHLQAISRQYSAEVWQVIERLDTEVLTENVNPLVTKAVNRALQRD